MSGSCPCLCGCAPHTREHCACGCERYAPDYVAEATGRGETDPAALRQLEVWQTDVARQLGYRPPGQWFVRRRCEYCGGRYIAARAHSRTCSGACRQALSVALSYEADVEVPSPFERAETFSAERKAATGFGVISAARGYRLDLRARRAPARTARRRARRATRRNG